MKKGENPMIVKETSEKPAHFVCDRCGKENIPTQPIIYSYYPEKWIVDGLHDFCCQECLDIFESKRIKSFSKIKEL